MVSAIKAKFCSQIYPHTVDIPTFFFFSDSIIVSGEQRKENLIILVS